MTTPTPAAPAPTEPPAPQPKSVSTRHSIRIKGKALNYTVTCGTALIREEKEKEGTREGTSRARSCFTLPTRSTA
jgi:hypothetical protein